ncbi:DUF4180 domain-containing protein [Shinella sp. H4-D48]|uniref:DUF4180 domain-containing protein n=1 Tax=Shinella sp. H4-D48 TaxID=2925841 RepID=UPI001F52CFBA|nr:DUF4180 domain-containing protein [Shinella sp. H4-D48]UNK39439.1 DUF4180 domain-containing protein [Shinella sp. H4-D48]
MQTIEMSGTKVLVLSAQGMPVATEADGNDVISEAFSAGATLVAIPVEQLGPDFLRLETRLAGTVFQKFVNYHLRCAIIGDVTALLEGSKALRDFVRETNKGRSIWFLATIADLETRLAHENT